jgi:hypothetical protein
MKRLAIHSLFLCLICTPARADFAPSLDTTAPGPIGACARIIVPCLDDHACFEALQANWDECHQADHDTCVSAEASVLHSPDWEKAKETYKVTFNGRGWANMTLLQCEPRP